MKTIPSVEGKNNLGLLFEMLTLTSNKTLFIWMAIISLVILLLILPIKLNYNLHVKGKILPSKEWVIYKGTDGRLTSLLTNYETGINQSYEVTLFDRGDAMRFNFNNQLHSGSSIKINDTIATVYSNEIERQIENLKGLIASSKASLILNATGEKESIINQEKNNLDYALKQAEEKKKILERTEALYKKGLVSLEEYEIIKGSYDLDEINIAISKARLESVKTGVKKEQVNLIKSQITHLENELDVLRKRSNSFTVTSPINGIISRRTDSDTLLTISDLSKFLVICPVKINDRKLISDSALIEIRFKGFEKNLTASIYEIDNNIKILNGLQVFTVTAKINERSKNMTPSLMVDCYINTGRLTPIQFASRIWDRMVN